MYTEVEAQFLIRFELGGDLENGSIKRVNQAFNRAFKIYREVIGFEEAVDLKIEEFENEFFDPLNKNKPYLYDLIKGDILERKSVILNNFDEAIRVNILRGKVVLEENQVEKTIRGIINLEMGFEPQIPQKISFFSSNFDRGMRIYDDRGCYIWSNDKKQLDAIYEQLIDWVLEYRT